MLNYSKNGYNAWKKDEKGTIRTMFSPPLMMMSFTEKNENSINYARIVLEERRYEPLSLINKNPSSSTRAISPDLNQPSGVTAFLVATEEISAA